MTGEDSAVTRVVLDKYESSIKQDLDNTLGTLASLSCVEIFGLDDTMLERATGLALAGIATKPSDQDMLAGVLVLASRLWDAGEREISFCETDGDLQPGISTERQAATQRRV